MDSISLAVKVLDVVESAKKDLTLGEIKDALLLKLGVTPPEQDVRWAINYLVSISALQNVTEPHYRSTSPQRKTKPPAE